MYVSLMCNPALIILYIWCLSNAFKYPVSVVVSYVCLVFHALVSGVAVITSTCLHMFFMSSVKFSVCPMYFNGQSRHFLRYMPNFSCLSVCEYGFIMFCIAFCVLNALLSGVSLKSF
jgi:hypothetical protein